MEGLFITVGVIALLAVLSGSIEHNRDVNKIRKIARISRAIGFRGVLASLILIGSLLILVCVMLSKLDVEIDRSILIMLFLLMSISAMVLFFIDYRVFTIVGDNPKSTSAILSLMLFLITLIVSVYVDAEISQLTRLDANYFPNAQKYILLLISPLFFGMALVFLSLIAYFFHAFILFVRALREIEYLNNVFGSISVILGIKRSKRKSQFVHDFAIILGFLVFILSAPVLLVDASKSDLFIGKIPELLIFSSYHSGSESCKNVEGADTKIAFLKGDIISVVKMVDGNYQFDSGDCLRPSTKLIQSTATST